MIAPLAPLVILHPCSFGLLHLSQSTLKSCNFKANRDEVILENAPDRNLFFLFSCLCNKHIKVVENGIKGIRSLDKKLGKIRFRLQLKMVGATSRCVPLFPRLRNSALVELPIVCGFGQKLLQYRSGRCRCSARDKVLFYRQYHYTGDDTVYFFAS